MQTGSILLLELIAVAAWAMTRGRGRSKPAWSNYLKGSQMLFGVIAVALTVVIILSPESLALGMAGESALFEMLVLALALQLHLCGTQALQRCRIAMTGDAWWLGIPSPGLCHLLAVLSIAMGSMVSAFEKAPCRVFS